MPPSLLRGLVTRINIKTQYVDATLNVKMVIGGAPCTNKTKPTTITGKITARIPQCTEMAREREALQPLTLIPIPVRCRGVVIVGIRDNHHTRLSSVHSFIPP